MHTLTWNSFVYNPLVNYVHYFLSRQNKLKVWYFLLLPNMIIYNNHAIIKRRMVNLNETMIYHLLSTEICTGCAFKNIFSLRIKSSSATNQMSLQSSGWMCDMKYFHVTQCWSPYEKWTIGRLLVYNNALFMDGEGILPHGIVHESPREPQVEHHSMRSMPEI